MPAGIMCIIQQVAEAVLDRSPRHLSLGGDSSLQQTERTADAAFAPGGEAPTTDRCGVSLFVGKIVDESIRSEDKSGAQQFRGVDGLFEWLIVEPCWAGAPADPSGNIGLQW